MYYAGIIKTDTANGRGIRTSLFVSGCRHHCKGCFNQETWDFHYGKSYTEKTEKKIIEYLSRDYIDGLTVLGGEPMEKENQETVLGLLRKVKKMGKSVWIYSGYTYEQICNGIHTEHTDEILSLTDVLVDGEFHIDEKDTTLPFRGSRNQRLIDVKETIKAGEVVECQIT